MVQQTLFVRLPGNSVLDSQRNHEGRSGIAYCRSRLSPSTHQSRLLPRRPEWLADYLEGPGIVMGGLDT